VFENKVTRKIFCPKRDKVSEQLMIYNKKDEHRDRGHLLLFAERIKKLLWAALVGRTHRK
jgi:hypothetical protein